MPGASAPVADEAQAPLPFVAGDEVVTVSFIHKNKYDGKKAKVVSWNSKGNKYKVELLEGESKGEIKEFDVTRLRKATAQPLIPPAGQKHDGPPADVGGASAGEDTKAANEVGEVAKKADRQKRMAMLYAGQTREDPSAIGAAPSKKMKTAEEDASVKKAEAEKREAKLTDMFGDADIDKVDD